MPTQIVNTPVLGGTAPRKARRTAQKLAGFALRFVDSIQCAPQFERYLDVGCGNGFITEFVAPRFEEVVGIDMEETRLHEFRAYSSHKPNFKILTMSAAKMDFPSEYFSFLTCFEVLEHVEDLEATVHEILRVCKRGGVLIISVPQVWFPFENHGARVGNRVYKGKIPLLPYLRPLHRKFALARLFSSSEMDRIFLLNGMELHGTSYASPQFERAASRESSWENSFMFLRDILNRCEGIPILRALTGVSMLKAYRKRE